MNVRLKKLATGALAVALAVGTAAVQAQQKVITMKASSVSLNDINHEYFKVFKAGIEARSNGRIKVDIFPAGQLGPLPRTVEGVTLGTIDLDQPAMGFLVGIDPRFIVFDAPGLFDNEAHAFATMRDTDLRKRVATMGAAKNLEALFVFVNGPLMLLSHNAIRTVDDLKGKRLRAPGGAPMHIEPFKKLGVSPLTMPLNEVLPAMQNKGIDGMMSGFSIMTAFKYWDIAKPVTELPGSFLVSAVITNPKTLASYGPELDAMVRAEARRAEELYTVPGAGLAADLERVRGLWRSNGGEIIRMSAAEQKRYVAEASSVLPPMLAADPKMKEDYDAIVATARKYRK